MSPREIRRRGLTVGVRPKASDYKYLAQDFANLGSSTFQIFQRHLRGGVSNARLRHLRGGRARSTLEAGCVKKKMVSLRITHVCGCRRVKRRCRAQRNGRHNNEAPKDASWMEQEKSGVRPATPG
jgi:hypothetical protein